jgi:uncharacterized protein (DUF1015 family)
MPEAINDVRPFCAEHYDSAKVGEWGQCLTRPYDVISPEEQDGYYLRHPYNVVRLILNKNEPGDDDGNNRYTRARDHLAAWRKAGIIKSTTRPSFWVYEEEFEAEGLPPRKLNGFIGLVRLQDYQDGRILPHENVIREPLEDRIRLTRATQTQFEYIWGVYPDPGCVVSNLLADVDRSQPVLDHAGQFTQVRHKLWRLFDEEKCAGIQQAFQKQKIYIADGHHRYQTMLTIRDEMRRLHPDAGPDAPWEFIMMFLVAANHEGLTTLPTHRMLKTTPLISPEILARAERLGFHIRKYTFDESDEIEAREAWLRELRNVGARERKFGLAQHDLACYYLFTISENAALKWIQNESGSKILRLLDVSLLNSIIFRQVLQLDDDQMKPQGNILYTPRTQVALDQVRSGKVPAAWFLNRTGLEEIMTVAENGEKMPQKSTHFYPKPLSGLVFFNMNGKY